MFDNIRNLVRPKEKKPSNRNVTPVGNSLYRVNWWVNKQGNTCTFGSLHEAEDFNRGIPDHQKEY